MLNSNKTVLVLPLLLMLIMFVGGYFFLSDTEEITNEQLKEKIELEASYHENGSLLVVNGEWNWSVMPIEGLYGDDYIGVAIPNVNNHNEIVATLELTYADDIIEQIDGKVVDNGIVFTFPNAMIEQISYGNSGRFKVEIDHQHNVDVDELSVHYLHTWTNHAPLDIEDAIFQTPTFEEAQDVPHWVLSKQLKK
ncbi:hypothetical protein [Bacillus sp. JCM 19034]|uniref:hypothetical protein n=1 Tax=Bacillus sp. JCM 19034 TaxID=1481928 RepID=UPI000780B48E|nr:hypothetical protein [Bacillus sp. JCM 19034]